ncbi:MULTISPECIES: hypothetical protein [unclassified Methylobacterium]|nr:MULTISPECIES: hypothetical protein [unclassified Methylobacterium]
MLVAGSIRWLLAVFALISPFAAATCSDAARQPESETNVVYRHFL